MISIGFPMISIGFQEDSARILVGIPRATHRIPVKSLIQIKKSQEILGKSRESQEELSNLAGQGTSRNTSEQGPRPHWRRSKGGPRFPQDFPERNARARSPLR